MAARSCWRDIPWFARRGWAAVFVGRLVPGVRTLISVPVGVAGMALIPFLLTTSLGTLLWTGLLSGRAMSLPNVSGSRRVDRTGRLRGHRP
ncbi:MAG: VTT domain-containing protein [Afipia sp.]|nr:VTT domain-containing protein [Afipia sp.]